MIMACLWNTCANPLPIAASDGYVLDLTINYLDMYFQLMRLIRRSVTPDRPMPCSPMHALHFSMTLRKPIHVARILPNAVTNPFA
jgi:hypothetical protein